jgi:putative DeoR family transcriptional regulator (stage III sporulation protein D)
MYISNNKNRCEILATYLVENKTTVRGVAKEFGVSKSTVHKDITDNLQKTNKTLYSKVKQILEQNKNERHIRGGEATKQKFLKIKKTQ